jgi:hypothetical protein
MAIREAFWFIHDMIHFNILIFEHLFLAYAIMYNAVMTIVGM